MPELPTETQLSIKPFTFHGCYVHDNGTKNVVGTCIFCGREDKFYVNTETTKWDCKVCGRYGNAKDFVHTLYEESSKYTTEQQLKELAKDRKLLFTDTLLKWGFAYSSARNEWIQAGYFSGSNRVKNLYRYTDYLSSNGKKRLLSTPTLEHCLLGVNLFDENKPNVYICEGAWDAMCLWEILRCTRFNMQTGELEFTGNEKISLLSESNVVATPGVNIFNSYWSKLLGGKNITIMFDNDHPRKDNKTGKIHEPVSLQGIKRLVKGMQEWETQPLEVKYLAWGGESDNHDISKPSGYDLRDLLTEGYTTFPSGSKQRIEELDKRSKNLVKLFEKIRPIPSDWIDPTTKKGTGKDGKISIAMIQCTEWKVLEDAWRDCMVWHKGLSKGLACMLAVIISTPQAGDQLWMKIISPPSSGKSVLCDAVCLNRKYVVPKSDIRGFYSGFKPSNDEKNQNSEANFSLINEIMNKTFVTKDGDMLLQSTNKEKILAQARDLYDGWSQSHYNNGMGKEYNNLRTTWLLCGTESLRSLDTSELGERFLDCVIIDSIDEDMERRIGLNAIQNMREVMKHKVTNKSESMDDPKRVRAKRLTAGYIDYLLKDSDKPGNRLDKMIDTVNSNQDVEMDGKIYELGLFVSYMRSRPSAKQEEKAHRELAARLPKQLFRLASCLAVVLNKERIDRQIFDLVYSVAMDTARGITFEMTKFLYRNTRGVTDMEIREQFNQKDDRITDILRFMRRINAFTFDNETMNNKVTSIGKYRLSKRFRAVCDRIFES